MVSRYRPESSQLLFLLIVSVHADNKVVALGINHKGSSVLDLNSLKIEVILPHLLNCYGDHSRKCTRRRQRRSQTWKCPLPSPLLTQGGFPTHLAIQHGSTHVQCSLEHSKQSSLMADYVEVKTHHCQATLEVYRDTPSQNLNFVLILWKS